MSQPRATAATPSVRRLNVPFLTAFAIVVAAYAVAFFVLHLLIPVDQMAGTLAALVLGGGPYVQRQIERRLRLPPGQVVTRTGYQRPWFVLLAISVVAIWLAQSALPFFQLRVGPMTAVVSSVDSLLRLLAPATALIVGVIVAQRSDRFALAVTVAAVMGGWLLDGVTYGLVVGFATGTNGPPNPVTLYLGDGLLGYLLASQLPLLIVAAMVGHWYGIRTRLQAYLGGLLREVEPEDQEAVVELTYEAARARASKDG